MAEEIQTSFLSIEMESKNKVSEPKWYTDPKHQRLFISFSGGRTSAVMTKKLIDKCSDKFDIKVLFANTGCEHPATLDFVDKCDREFGWNVVWVEAKVDFKKGVGVGYNIVDYATASRNGEPFEDCVRKYGIFNPVNPACTNRTKLDPMNTYLKDQGWKFGKQISHYTAVGIRADEMDRVSENALARDYIYPMVDWQITKRDVAIEMKKWHFDLEIPGDHYGNCVWCWKKAFRKLYTVAQDDPSYFNFPKRMEEKYGRAKPDMKSVSDDGTAYWFRKNTPTEVILRIANEGGFERYSDDPYQHAYDFDPDIDVGGSCGDSCEIGADL